MSLYKVASSCTLLIRDSKILEYETSTLPLKYDNIFDLYEIDLIKNDLILLMTDGVYDFIDKKSLYAYIISISYLDTDKLVYNIGKYIYDISYKKLKDDTSILAIKVV